MNDLFTETSILFVAACPIIAILDFGSGIGDNAFIDFVVVEVVDGCCQFSLLTLLLLIVIGEGIGGWHSHCDISISTIADCQLLLKILYCFPQPLDCLLQPLDGCGTGGGIVVVNDPGTGVCEWKAILFPQENILNVSTNSDRRQLYPNAKWLP